VDAYRIKKSLFGSRSVQYDCPRCNAALSSSLDDAGKPDTCPDCGARFIVPGAEERDRIRGEEAAAAKERSEQKELARRERELQRQEELRRLQEANERAAAVTSQSQMVETQAVPAATAPLIAAPVVGQPQTPPHEPVPAGRHWIICPNPNCGYRGPARKEPRGSLIVGLLLCFLFLLPGLIYLVFMSGYTYCCPQCGLHIRSGAHI
jgi:DNA-directed RNA polymerase subunit RPC12/RpoP